MNYPSKNRAGFALIAVALAIVGATIIIGSATLAYINQPTRSFEYIGPSPSARLIPPPTLCPKIVSGRLLQLPCPSPTPTPRPTPIPSPSPDLTILPQAPTILYIKVLSCQSTAEVLITWQDNSNNEDGFKVSQRKSNEDFWTQIADSQFDPVDDLAYRWLGAQINTDYLFRVGAYNQTGVNWSNSYSLRTTCP